MSEKNDYSALENRKPPNIQEMMEESKNHKKQEWTHELPKPRKVRVSRRLHLLVKCLFNHHNINDGTTCEISRLFWDVHDYKITKGGDGVPRHFYIYVCPQCGKTFGI